MDIAHANRWDEKAQECGQFDQTEDVLEELRSRFGIFGRTRRGDNSTRMHESIAADSVAAGPGPAADATAAADAAAADASDAELCPDGSSGIDSSTSTSTQEPTAEQRMLPVWRSPLQEGLSTTQEGFQANSSTDSSPSSSSSNAAGSTDSSTRTHRDSGYC